jgi:hypothetical protein
VRNHDNNLFTNTLPGFTQDEMKCNFPSKDCNSFNGQRITTAVCYMYFQIGISAVSYLDDFGGAEILEYAQKAYECLGEFLIRLFLSQPRLNQEG